MKKREKITDGKIEKNSSSTLTNIPSVPNL